MNPLIRPDSLIGMYLKLKEGGTPSDFPLIMADVQHKLLIEAFKGFPSSYESYAMISDVNDFREHNREWLSEAEDLLEVQPDGPYMTTPFKDRSYKVAVTTKGRTFRLLRKTVINDDLMAFKQIPSKLGRAAKRSVAKSVVAPLESNGNAYDGNPLFGTRSGLANFSYTDLTADVTGIEAVQAGISAMARSTDPDSGEMMGARAKYLVTSPTRAEAAKWITSSTNLERGSTDGPASNPLRSPALSEALIPLVEPMLTKFPNRWYLLADPNETPVLEVAFLNGVREPELFMKESDAVRIAGGGRDAYGYEYDDIQYKVRWDWGVAVAFYQGAFKGGN